MTVSARVRVGCGRQDTWREWLLVAALTVFAVAPLAYPGVVQTRSGPLPAFKAAHLADAPAWLDTTPSQHGEGDLPYLLVWPILRLSASGFVAARWGYILAMLLAALAMYAWTHRWLGSEGGVLAAMVYTYLPWHLGTVYIRGAYAEAWLWALWPAILWALDRVADRRDISRPGLIASGILGLLAVAATFATHPGLAAISLPLLVGYSAARLTTRRRPVWVGIGIALATGGLCLVALGRQGSRPYTPSDFLYPYELLSAAWGQTRSLPQSELDPSGWTAALPVSYQLGLAAMGLSVVATALFKSRRSNGSESSGENPSASERLPGHVFWFWVTAVLVAILLTLRPAARFWQITGLHTWLAQPWQLLAIAGLPLSFLAGSTVRLDERLAKLPAWAGLVGLVVLASYPYLAPRCIPAASREPTAEPVALFRSDETASPQILIISAEVIPTSGPGPEPQALTLTLTWQSLAPVEQDYTVFVHLLAEAREGTRIAQRDVRPCSGGCPTNAWQPGDIIVTRYEFDVPANAAPGPYRLAVGLYILETGERAAVVGQEDDAVYLDVQ